MTGLFSTVLNMSLVGSLTAAVIFLIRWCLKRRAPRWISYALWAVVLIRLFVPVSISSPVSLFSLLPSPQRRYRRGKREAIPVGCYGRRSGRIRPASSRTVTGQHRCGRAG